MTTPITTATTTPTAPAPIKHPPSPQPTHQDAATPPPLPPIPPPNTFPTAHLQVLGGFLLMFNTWGYILAYGRFQTFYTTSSLSPFTAAPSTTAWIGSLQAFLLLFVGGLCGRAFDAGYLRGLLLTGSGFIVVGLMLASLARTYWQALLSQGLCVGLGMGCLLVPSVGTASTWWVEHRGLAVGVVTSGSAVGGTVLPIMVERLLGTVGYAWTLRVMGFVSLGTLGVSVAVMRCRLPPRKRGGWVEWRAMREAGFGCYVVGMGAAMLGFYVFLQFVQSWAEATHPSTFPPQYYLPITNAASILGRLLPPLLSDTLGPLNVQIPCALISSLLLFVWLAVHSLGPLITLCLLYGFFSGGMLALPPASVASLTSDMRFFGGRMGVCFISMGIGSLVGTPVMGAIVGERGEGGNWVGGMVWGGVTIAVGGGLMGLGRWIVGRERRGKEEGRWVKV